MTSGRRLLVLLLVVALVGVPAVVLRAFCVGKSCPSDSSAGAVAVPFCPLPATLRTLIEQGFYADQSRSPDVFAIAKDADIAGGTGTTPSEAAPVWPSLSDDVPTSQSSPPATEVPIAFSGAGVAKAAKVPSGTGLDQIAPTVAQAIGLNVPHPELHAGKAIPGVASAKNKPALILEIAWAGVGSRSLSGASTPYLKSLINSGAGTMQGTTGSLPVDAAATLTTIGTGALPYQHGIPGSVLRNKNGELVEAWSPGAPISVLATLGDDLTFNSNGKSLLGLIAPDTIDRGIVGGHWYPGTPDRAQIIKAKGRSQIAAAGKLLGPGGFGADSTPDILAVVISRTGVTAMDEETHAIVDAAEQATGGATMVVVAGTGDAGESKTTNYVTGAEIVRQVEQSLGARVVTQAVPGGLYLDQTVLSDKGITAGKVVTALAGVRRPASGAAAPDGEVMDQAFPAFSITFARYC